MCIRMGVVSSRPCRRMIGNGERSVCMKAVLICGGAIAGLVAVVLVIAHGKRMCRYATIFLDHY